MSCRLTRAKAPLSYFETAALRSEYPIDNLSYVLFEDVPDPHILEAALTTMKRSMDSANGEFFGESATGLDTYANLVHKAGRTEDAIAWEEKALQLSAGRDGEIVAHFNAMKAGILLFLNVFVPGVPIEPI